MNDDKKKAILDKIQKLLSLATSSNEHEAKLAAEKANELLVKYNLSMQDVSSTAQREYEEKEFHGKTKFANDEMQLFGTLQRFFFVRVVLGHRWDSEKKKHHVKVNFIGEKSNVEIASYVYSFLVRAVRDVFNEKRRTGVFKESDRKSFVTGFVMGLNTQLEQTKKRVETSMSLVVRPDPGLQDYMRKKYPNLRSATVNEGHGQAKEAGYQHGLNVRIHKGVTGSSGTAGLRLGPGGKQ